MKIRTIFFAFCMAALTPVFASADQDTQNIYATVTVLPNFSVNLDNNFLDFGLIQPGQTVTLKEGSYYNKVTCVSNKGKPWYLKLSLIGEVIGPGGIKLDPSNIKWKVYSADGEGVISEDWHDFSKASVPAYTAQGEDLNGKRVTVCFQYSLSLPNGANAGHYTIQVLYALTEEK